MNAQPSLTHVPLDRLILSQRNARKTGGRDVANIAASIAAHGLLQNLTITAPEREGNAFEVVAGGRRLAALQQLASERRLPDELARDGIPCRLITVDVALEASTAENTLREAMHPADQCDAFKAMIEAGETIPDVAAHFGVPEIVVKQRLKLANVNPKLVEIYREGGMNLDQLQALAITDNHELQRQAWYTAKQDYERQPHNLREFITREEVEATRSPLLKFVGLEAYEAAGGQVRRDLFSDRTWLRDSKLLDTLAMDKLEAVAHAEREAGWSWAEVHLHMDYAADSEYPQGAYVQSEYASEADEVRSEAITARMSEIEMGDAEGDDDALNEEHQRLDAEWDEIEARRVEKWTDAMKATMGVLVTIDYHGKLDMKRGRLRPGQKLDRKSGNVTGEARGTQDAAAKPAKKPELSAAVLNVLSAHRSEVARHHLARDPQLALALLVEWSISRMKHDFSETASTLKLSGTSVPNARNIASDIHKALSNPEDAGAGCFKKLPKKGRLAWLVKQPQADLLDMLALCVAQQFGGTSESPGGHDGIAELHAILGFDMADHWNAGCDNFLGRIPAALVLQAVTEAKGATAAASLKGLKKDALVAEAAKHLAGTGWLPKPLRGPGYDLKGAKAAPAKKNASKSRAAKKGTLKKKPAKRAAKTLPKKASSPT